MSLEENRVGDRILPSRRTYDCADCGAVAQHPKRDQRPIGWWTVSRDYDQVDVHLCERCKKKYPWP